MNTPLLPPPTEMERAYLERDSSYNGIFFLGVRTTGIFCRPTCPARKPLPKNVEYFANAGHALAAGYRPCRRCLPLALDDEPAWAANLIAEIEGDPSKRLTGALSFLREGGTLDEAVYESGYDSHSGFREAFSRAFGSPPGASRERECVLLAWMKSPLGPLVAGATGSGICLLEFTDRTLLEAQIASVRRVFAAPMAPGTNAHLARLQEEIDSYFAGSLRRFSVPLAYPGTPFQVRVWEQLLRIPYGETRSYQEMAAAVGQPRAVRAVGGANGLNRIAIVIPCHRVVNKDGQLCGYGGGTWRKQYLLDLENR